MPGDDDVKLHDVIINQHEVICPECGAQLDPELQKQPFVVTRLVGVTTKPKTRQCIEVYGGLYVKVPNYAMRQSDMPYLEFSYETHYSNAIERFPNLKKNGDKAKIQPGATVDTYEQWGRLSPEYRNAYPTNTVTVRNFWLRPAAFNILNSDDDIKDLKKRFPDGAKVIFINQ